MATEVVNSYNLYIDSERCLNSNSTGDDLHLSLNQTPITCADNQYIRLTLQSFSMYKSFTNVNTNNNIFRISGSFADPGAPAPTQDDFPVYLPCLNYQDRNALADQFANSLATNLATLSNVGLAANPILNPDDATIFTPNPPESGNTDNIIQFYILFAAAHQISDLRVRLKVSDGDSFELLGGDRIRNTDPATANSIFINTAPPAYAGNPSNRLILVTCKYNCQETTQQNVYLRTDLNNTNIETESFNAGNDDFAGNQLTNSRILGKLIIDNEFINYTTGTQMEYFISLTTKQVTYMRLFLTDSHGRKIPPNINYSATGNTPDPNFVPVNQATLGNRSFECVIKVDIVQYMGGQNNVLQSEPVQHTIPARFGTEPLNKLAYGESGYPDVNYSPIARMQIR